MLMCEYIYTSLRTVLLIHYDNNKQKAWSVCLPAPTLKMYTTINFFSNDNILSVRE